MLIMGVVASIAAPQAVGWRHESSQQTSLSNHELEAIQRGSQGSRLSVNLDGQADGLVCRCQRQTRAKPEVL